MMTVTLTKAQWAAALEALDQFVENERCNYTYDNADKESEHLAAATEVLEMLQAPLIALAG